MMSRPCSNCCKEEEELMTAPVLDPAECIDTTSRSPVPIESTSGKMRSHRLGWRKKVVVEVGHDAKCLG